MYLSARLTVTLIICLSCAGSSNVSNNSTVDEDNEEDDDNGNFAMTTLIPMGLVMACLIVLAIVGNLLTIISYARDRHLHNVYNTFILNLAVADFLIGCLSMGIYSSYDLASYHWFFGHHFCKVWLIVDFTLCLESVLIVFILSTDRLLLLKMGPSYNQRMTITKAIVCIVISWIIAFLVYSPAIIGYDIWTGIYPVEDGDCDVAFVNDVIFTSVTAVLEFCVPLIGISLISIAIYIEIRKRIKQTKLMKIQSTRGNEDSNSTQREANSRRDVKAAKFLAALVLLFVVTWAPYTVTTVIISFSDHTLVTDDLYESLTWINWSKASINPFLYAFNSARFRKNFSELLGCKTLFKKNKVNVQPSNHVENRTEASNVPDT